MTHAERLRDEQRRMRQVRVIVDLVSAVIMQGRLPRHEAEALVDAGRTRILQLFPGREETYELLYGRRFERLLDEFAQRAGAQILPFHRPEP